ncbi:SPW repeat protein [Rhodococcus sp. NPDC003318]|uniref:SPW repeat protein n=1 Tax=Rhodococcus sp. NPDC003318 TaxID=3364503 RepID=UPI00369D3A0F
MSTSTHGPIHTHPDIVELRQRYDEAAEQPPAQIADGLMLIAGLYAAASAWIVGFAGQMSLTMSNLITGLAIAALAVGFLSAYGRTHGMTFVAPVLGIWLIVSPWIVVGVDTTTSMIWSNVVAGAAVCILALAMAATGPNLMRRSRQR